MIRSCCAKKTEKERSTDVETVHTSSNWCTYVPTTRVKSSYQLRGQRRHHHDFETTVPEGRRRTRAAEDRRRCSHRGPGKGALSSARNGGKSTTGEDVARRGVAGEFLLVPLRYMHEFVRFWERRVHRVLPPNRIDISSHLFSGDFFLDPTRTVPPRPDKSSACAAPLAFPPSGGDPRRHTSLFPDIVEAQDASRWRLAARIRTHPTSMATHRTCRKAACAAEGFGSTAAAAEAGAQAEVVRRIVLAWVVADASKGRG